MKVFLKHGGTTDGISERLNMSVETSASWYSHALRARPWMPSGPGVVGGLILLKD